MLAANLHHSPLDEAIRLIRSNKAAAALPLLEDIARTEPENKKIFPWLALCYLETDRLPEARTALETSLALKVDCAPIVEVTLDFAHAYQARQDHAEVEKLLLAVIKVCPDNLLSQAIAQNAVLWSDLEEKEGKLQEAVRHLEISLEALPSNDPARRQIPHKLAEYYRRLAAEAEVKNRNEETALAFLEKSLQSADEPATHMVMAAIYLRQKKIQKAIEHYRIVCANDPNNLEARHNLVNLLLESADLQAAEATLAELSEQERTAENYELLASIRMKLHNQAGAVRALDAALEFRPEEIRLLKKLENSLRTWAKSLAEHGKQEESMPPLARAERIAEIIKKLSKPEDILTDQQTSLKAPSTVPNISIYASRIWLAKGSLTPEGEIRIKNISSCLIDDLTLTAVFYDNTRRIRNGSVAVSVVNPSYPMQPGEIRSVYISCPNIVRAEDKLSVIIFWKRKLLGEFPVTKEP